MDDILICKAADAEVRHRREHEDYEYYKRELVPLRKNGQCKIAFYEIPPGQAAYPYHYHVKNEEAFYIIQGEGLLKTPNGSHIVTAGDFIFFPANENGAHRLTNTSKSDMLTYLDFDTCNDIDIAFYPDSGKLGIWGKDINQLYRINDQIDYFDGE